MKTTFEKVKPLRIEKTLYIGYIRLTPPQIIAEGEDKYVKYLPKENQQENLEIFAIEPFGTQVKITFYNNLGGGEVEQFLSETPTFDRSGDYVFKPTLVTIMPNTTEIEFRILKQIVNPVIDEKTYIHKTSTDLMFDKLKKR